MHTYVYCLKFSIICPFHLWQWIVLLKFPIFRVFLYTLITKNLQPKKPICNRTVLNFLIIAISILYKLSVISKFAFNVKCFISY